MAAPEILPYLKKIPNQPDSPGTIRSIYSNMLLQKSIHFIVRNSLPLSPTTHRESPFTRCDSKANTRIAFRARMIWGQLLHGAPGDGFAGDPGGAPAGLF
jgi:hypothetical protein